MDQKTTNEIRAILSKAKLDFESVENKALNNYLPKIFHSCPFTEDICTTNQCSECEILQNASKKVLPSKKTKIMQEIQVRQNRGW